MASQAHPENHYIIAVHCTERVTKASHMQDILTEHGKSMTTRLGVHQPGSLNGIIIVEVLNKQDADNIVAKMNKLEGVEAKMITFGH